jgi:hypothetical protein
MVAAAIVCGGNRQKTFVRQLQGVEYRARCVDQLHPH